MADASRPCRFYIADGWLLCYRWHFCHRGEHSAGDGRDAHRAVPGVELASIYPLAGGMYCLVDKILPKPLSWITIFNYLLQGIVIPASLALGIGVSLRDLWPSVIWPDWLIALIVLTMAGAITMTRVEVGAWVTLTMGHRGGHRIGHRNGCSLQPSATKPG